MKINEFLKIYFFLKEKYGPYHQFTRNILLIIKGEFGSDGLNACLREEPPLQEAQEEKTPESNAPRRVKKQKQKKI